MKRGRELKAVEVEKFIFSMEAGDRLIEGKVIYDSHCSFGHFRCRKMLPSVNLSSSLWQNAAVSAFIMVSAAIYGSF